MNVFEAVKQSVTTRQAAEHYGMRLLSQRILTGNTFTIILFTTPLRWTAPGNSVIFYCPGWLCNG